ncbi:hypothetical protein [Jeotgalibacillus salarius]|uniref:Flagellar hook-length control protein FliK n=1 Tax=Jeotgalibacillus salarius TaxID=546023 RepID=A0A4Y8LMS4_9BACL|nr:hypothetical protein [Jeotgalibacillus salarius]TFE02741.1 hypothetical protein E2626_02765 [Jeotgalibacillus salarius]
MASYISGQQRAAVSTQQQDRQQPLKTGQIVHGKMLKSLGNQQMDIQVGGRTLTAVVSGAFSEGEAKWFQVESAGNPLVLKPVKTDGSGKADVQQLLQSIGLGGNKEVKALLSSMIEKQVSVTTEKLSSAATLLSGITDKEEGLSVLKWMVSKDLPLKESIFRPLLSANAGISEPISGLLNQMKNLLQSQGQTPLNQVMQSVQEPYAKMLQDHTIQRLFEKMSDGSPAVRNQALEGLKSLQVLPQNATLNNWAITADPVQMLKGSENILKALHALPQSQNVQAQINQLEQAVKVYQQSGAAQQLAEAVIKAQGVLLQVKPQSPLSIQSMQLPSADFTQPHQSVRTAAAEVQSLIGQQNSSSSIQMMLKEVIQRMGTDYEARLLNAGNSPETATQTLKAQLVSLLSMQGINTQVRESAEQVLNRLNGMQLLSAENGPQQQLIMQFPIQLGAQHTDVMMKLNGRKKSDGTLDPEHVRVLFYITLSELKESIIDMNVQNSVVSLDIYNENEHLNQLAKPFVPALKTALQEAGYSFSSVKFHSTREVDPPIMNPAEDALSSAYHKVDLKI